MRNSTTAKTKRNHHSQSRTSNTSTPSRKSLLQERRLKDLEAAFMQATEKIINDPLMQVFREKEDTHIFMFERIQEIINEGMREANNKYVNQVIIKMKKLSQFNQNLKNENFELKQVNFSLQKQVDEIEDNMTQSYQEKVTEFSSEVENFQMKFEKVCEEKKQIEKKLRSQTNEIEEIVQNLVEKEREESQAIDTIKRIERENQELKNKLEKKKSEIGYMEAKMDIFSKEKDDILDQLREREKEFKKRNFESKEIQNDTERKVRALKEEVEILKQNNEEMKSMIQDNTRVEDYKARIKFLEKNESELKDGINDLRHRFEDADFENTQLKQTIQNLKGELNELTMKLSLERKEKHQLQIANIELKDINSELNLNFSNAEEELKSLKQEKGNSNNESELKKVRRKAATLERELDQIKFSNETLNRDNNELIVGFRNQVEHLKKENKNLGMRLEKNIKMHQEKLEEERNYGMEIKEVLRKMKESEENFIITIENLKQQVMFYKKKNLGSSKKSENDHNQQQQQLLLIDSRKLKSSIKTLLKRYKNLKSEIAREFRQLVQDLNYYQTQVAGLTDTLVIGLTSKSMNDKREIFTLKQNIQFLQKINDDFNVKLNSQDQSISRLTYNYETNSTFNNPESKFRMESLKNKSAPGYQNMSQPSQQGKNNLKNCYKSEIYQKKLESGMKNFSDHTKEPNHLLSTVEIKERNQNIQRLKQRSENYTRERRMRDMNKYYRQRHKNENQICETRRNPYSENKDLSKDSMKENMLSVRNELMNDHSTFHEMKTQRNFNSHCSSNSKQSDKSSCHKEHENFSLQSSEEKKSDIDEEEPCYSDENSFIRTDSSIHSDNLHLIKFHTQSVTDETTIGKVTERRIDAGFSIIQE